MEDCYHASYDGAPADGSAWVGACPGNIRVFRGGGIDSTVSGLRSAHRYNTAPVNRYVTLGARCLRPSEP